MRSVMLDLETWGTRPGSALRSIGAVAFEADGKIGTDFYMNIAEISCRDVGLEFDPDTIAWWDKQSQQARDALEVDQQPLNLVVGAFHEWFLAEDAIYVWSHGANFDEPLWTAAAHACGERVPWQYWNSRCTRTLFHLARLNIKTVPRAGDHHNALDDCRFQVECVHRAYDMLRAKATA